MKIAVPIYGSRISPRFDFSPEIWLVEVKKGEIMGQERFHTAGLNLIQRLEWIAANGVDKLICGGIDLFSRNQLGSRGVDVIHDVMGEPEAVFDLFLRKRLQPGLFCKGRGKKYLCLWGRSSGKRKR